jgi:hypothetical protein
MRDEEAPPPPETGRPLSSSLYAPSTISHYRLPPDHPQATQILVFGIIGLVVCMPFGIAAWVMGNRALIEIATSRGTFGGEGQVQAGRILGIVSVWLSVAALLLAILLLLLGVGSSSPDPDPGWYTPNGY